MQDKIMQKMVDNVFCVANRITGDKIVNINKFFINHNGVKSEFIIAINMLWICLLYTSPSPRDTR